MERLTARMDDGTAYVCSETGCEGTGHFTTQRRLPELIAKLAAYEDTGLEPEEIEFLHKHSDVEHNPATFGTITYGAYKHALEMIDAEEQGRLVVLPCKVGDAVYRIMYCHEYCLISRHGRCVDCDEPYAHKYSIIDGVFNYNDIPLVGNTVFLTREAAEARLREMEGENG